MALAFKVVESFTKLASRQARKAGATAGTASTEDEHFKPRRTRFDEETGEYYSESMDVDDDDLTVREREALERWYEEEAARKRRELEVRRIEKEKSKLDIALSRTFGPSEPAQPKDDRATAAAAAAAENTSVSESGDEDSNSENGEDGEDGPGSGSDKKSPRSAAAVDELPNENDYSEPWYIRVFCCTTVVPQRTAAEQRRRQRKVHKWQNRNKVRTRAALRVRSAGVSSGDRVGGVRAAAREGQGAGKGEGVRRQAARGAPKA
jgi:hypothetical protein